jgi:hypothetical protein
MFALGHKRTFAVQKVMSALPLKADIGCVLDYRSVGDAAVTTAPVYARDTDWSSRIGLLRRTPMLAFS